MIRAKPKKVISVHASANDYSAISEKAAQSQMSVSTFMRLASLERADVRPFFSEEDLLVIGHLRGELRDEGNNLMDLLRGLNRNEVFDDAKMTAEILAMQRTIAALCVELKACIRAGAAQQREHRDAAH